MKIVRRICCLQVLMVLLLTLAPAAMAKNLTLVWDSNAESDVVGYKLYYKSDSSSAPLNGTGASEGPSPIDIGDVTTASLTGLPDDRVHYITVTAYNASGQESAYADIVTSAAIVSDDSTSGGNNSGNDNSGSGGNDSSNDDSDIADNTWYPLLWYPANGAIAESIPVQIDWEPLPGGSQATFTLYYGTDPFLGANNLTAAVAPLGAPALLAGIFVFGGFGLATGRRRLLSLLMLSLLVAGSLLSGCGGGGGGGGSSSDPAPGAIDTGTIVLPDSTFVRVIEGLEDNTFTVEDLQPGTTYYWKVVAVDGQSRVESDVYSFTTKAN